MVGSKRNAAGQGLGQSRALPNKSSGVPGLCQTNAAGQRGGQSRGLPSKVDGIPGHGQTSQPSGSLANKSLKAAVQPVKRSALHEFGL